MTFDVMGSEALFLLLTLLLASHVSLIGSLNVGHRRLYRRERPLLSPTGPHSAASSKSSESPLPFLVPNLLTPCLETLDTWLNLTAPSDKKYRGGLQEARAWVEDELSDRAFETMSEDEQRELDAWAFTVCSPTATTGEYVPSTLPILCAELVNQVGRTGGDTTWYWPTIRLRHLIIPPPQVLYNSRRGPTLPFSTAFDGLQATGVCIIQSAEAAMAFCDGHMLRLDHTMLRLALSSNVDCEFVSAATPERNRNDEAVDEERDNHAETAAVTSIEWVDGTVNWTSLFEALSGRDTYSEDDYIPGAT